jgi:hypothetical protein
MRRRLSGLWDLVSGRFEASTCSRHGYLHPEPCNS